MEWTKLDLQLQRYRTKLIDDINLDTESANKLASVMHNELTSLTQNDRSQVLQVFNPVSLESVYQELTAFQRWMETDHDTSPFTSRAKVIVQNYVCFLYLRDGCFAKLASIMQDSSTIRKVSLYLTSGPIRAFRNALAHGKWQYSEDFKSLIYWDWDDPKNKNNIKWEVNQIDLDFWQKLSRCVAYVFYQTMQELDK